jgi:hypothetical protein
MANVPPPIAFHEIDVGKPIQDVDFSADGSGIGILCEDEAYYYNYPLSSKPPLPPAMDQKVLLFSNDTQLTRQICMKQNQGFYLIADAINEPLTSISFHYLKHTTPLDIEQSTMRMKNIFPSNQRDTTFVQVHGASIYTTDAIAWTEERLDLGTPLVTFPSEVLRVETAYLEEISQVSVLIELNGSS